jgi:hypothetical protein
MLRLSQQPQVEQHLGQVIIVQNVFSWLIGDGRGGENIMAMKE